MSKPALGALLLGCGALWLIVSSASRPAVALGLVASVDTSGPDPKLVIRSNAYGAHHTFTVAATNGTAGLPVGTTTATDGVDVAGTINGVAATGFGQLLSGAATDPLAGGLVLKVTSAVGGTFEYAPGLAQRLATVGNDSTNSVTGLITNAIQGRQNEINQLGDAIADWDVRLALRKQTLQKQFTDMEVALGQLKDQSNWLAGQLASLPSASGNG